MLVNRFVVVALAVLLASAGTARADDQPPIGCSVSSADISQETGIGNVSIGCAGLSEALGNRLADILTRILQNRLDPAMVWTKLDEVDRIPDEGVARTVDESQRQLILQYLHGKESAQIAIGAHMQVEDSADFAKAIATALLSLGWQIEGNQIRRAAPKALDQVYGLAIIVKERLQPPPKALLLKSALAAAHIGTQLISDPTMPPEATMLWVGRRPVFTSTDAAK
jgi:hypothetical protein